VGHVERHQQTDQRTSPDDADTSKPDPDIVLAALHKAHVARGGALMLGDAPHDLQAATQAAVVFVGLTGGGYDAQALHGALAASADPAALLTNLPCPRSLALREKGAMARG